MRFICNTQDMSIEQLNTLYTAAVAFIDSGDYSAAILKLMAIQIRLATTPNLNRATGGGGSQGIAWNAAQIDSLIAQCNRLIASDIAASTGPFQQTKIKYARAEAE